MKAATASNALLALTALHSEVMSDVLAELEHYKNAVELMRQRQPPLEALLATGKKWITSPSGSLDGELADAIKACGG